MNPDKIALYFYEKGKADSVEKESRESKNIKMGVKETPKQFSKNGLKISAVEAPNDRNGRLTIKKRK